MNEQREFVYTAKVHAPGGPGGAPLGVPTASRYSDFASGDAGTGTNPEQLFAAGWSAWFETAIGIGAHRVTLPPDLAIDAEVDLSLVGGFYILGVRLNVSLPGLPRDVAQALVDEADTLCPYSRAIQVNIDVTTTPVQTTRSNVSSRWLPWIALE